MSGISGFPLSDQWAGMTFVNYTDLIAKIDAQINLIAAYMSAFPATANDYATEASGATGSLATSGTVVFPTVTTNPGSGYSSSTGIYTIPTAGTYVCSFALTQSTAVAFSAGLVGLPSSGYPAGGYVDSCDAVAGGGPSIMGLVVPGFLGGESLKVKRSTQTGTVTLNGGFFMVRRIGA